MIGKLRALYRLCLFGVVTSAMLAFYLLSRTMRPATIGSALALRAQWMRRVPQWMGLRTHLTTPLPDATTGVMFVSNHRSYLDPIMIGAWVNGVVIAKHEVSKWPLIGAANRAAGVVFVKRDESGSRHTVKETMKDVLQQGYPVLNYPEGTTTRAPNLLPFKDGGFKVAAETGCVVIPVAIEFDDPDDAWVGDDTFLRHFFQTFSKRRITARVAFGPVLQSDDDRYLRETAHAWIAAALPSLRAAPEVKAALP
ncbi:MAG: lysophospholipid acyltransferase family protein [Saprospiraceae bacterium]|nr:lysophospholipid acyltransferase family protein [Saprospiraceae bacterium]